MHTKTKHVNRGKSKRAVTFAGGPGTAIKTEEHLDNGLTFITVREKGVGRALATGPAECAFR